MKVKSGVSLVGVVWQMFASSIVVEEVLEEEGYECIITSGSEGKHTDETSLHYRGRALDYRHRHIPAEKRKEVTDKIRARVRRKLGPSYQVFLKKDHIHTEHDPRMEGVE